MGAVLAGFAGQDGGAAKAVDDAGDPAQGSVRIAARVSTSLYSGENNVFLDPSSPVTTYRISDNGIEHVQTETVTLSLTSNLSLKLASAIVAPSSRETSSSRKAFQMTLADARESVTVSAEAKAVETEPRGLSAVIDERRSSTFVKWTPLHRPCTADYAIPVTLPISTCGVPLSCGDIPSEVPRAVYSPGGFEGELALAVGGLLVAKAGGGVYQGDVGLGDAADGGIEDGSVDGPG